MIKLASNWPMEHRILDHSAKGQISSVPVSKLLANARIDAAALDALFGAYRSYLRLHLRGDKRIDQIRTKADRSDVLQMTLMEAYRDFGSFRGKTQNEFSAWLHGSVTLFL